MTDREKAIVMAYTGIAMLTGNKFDIFHKYVEDIMGRPVFTHEFATCAEEIKEKAKPDFLKLCEESTPEPEMIKYMTTLNEGLQTTITKALERPRGKWLSHYDYCKKHGYIPSGLIAFWWCNQCEQGVEIRTNFCPKCGADMTEGGDQE